jgi:hypothetical protein
LAVFEVEAAIKLAGDGIECGGKRDFECLIVGVVCRASGAEVACRFDLKVRILIEETGAILNKALRIGYKELSIYKQ